MVDFTTRTLKNQDSVLIDHGSARSNYKIPETIITWNMLERLYTVYETSVPDKNRPALCTAKTESDLTMADIIFGAKRSKAQEDFEQAILIGILNGSLRYPDNTKWFWQSSKYRNMIIPKWIFESCDKTVHHARNSVQENELWDRNLVARRLRQILNTDPEANIPWNSDFKTCLLTIREELAEKTNIRYFTDEIIDELLHAYMTHLPKKYIQEKARIGQYIAALKKAKMAYKKVKAIDDILANCPMYAYEYQNKKWITAYGHFVNHKTIAFISEFIPDVSMPDFSENTDRNVEQYVLLNKNAICKYAEIH
jgi:hypothetical protein